MKKLFFTWRSSFFIIKDPQIYNKINPLGRWNIDYCKKKIDKKVDLSNEDHCGPCGSTIINKEFSKENKKENKKENNNIKK